MLPFMKEEIKKSIASGDLQTAINLLLEATTNSEGNNQTVIAISSQYRTLKKKEKSGVLSQDAIMIEINRITANILEILEEENLNQRGDTPYVKSGFANGEYSTQDKQRNRGLWFWMKLLLAPAVLAAIISGQYLLSNTEKTLSNQEKEYLVDIVSRDEIPKSLQFLLSYDQGENPSIKSRLSEDGEIIFITRQDLVGKSFYITFAQSKQKEKYRITNNPTKLNGELITVNIEAIPGTVIDEPTQPETPKNMSSDPRPVEKSYTFSGQIIDKITGEGIPNAKILINDREIGVSNKSGIINSSYKSTERVYVLTISIQNNGEIIFRKDIEIPQVEKHSYNFSLGEIQAK